MGERSARGFANGVVVGFAVLLFLLGLATTLGGGYLLYLGGSPYFLLSGLVTVVAAVLIYRGLALGVWLYVANVALTVVWSFWEIAGKGWMPAWQVDLLSRTGLLVLLMIVAIVLLPAIHRRRDPSALRSPPSRYFGHAVVIGAVAAVVWLLVALYESVEAPDASGETADTAGAASLDDTDWPAYGGTNLARRFADVDQITPANISEMEEVWEFNTGDTRRSEDTPYAFQNTPIKVGDSLYVCSPSNQVFALDPATGESQWHFDPEIEQEAMENVFSTTCRAVAYFEAADEVDECPRRILLGTLDGRLLALNADDGSLCEGFGNQGEVDLKEHMDPQALGLVSNTSGPTVVGDVVVVGHQVTDNQRRDAPSGAVRAYDAVTGDWLWTWDAIWQTPESQPADGEVYPRGTPNVWAPISADEELGLVYLPTGSPANDQYGGDRTTEEDEFTATLVAVEADTGEVRWRFTTVLHDLWDYDLGAQPALIDYPTDEGDRPAVVQATKFGETFVLDRETGEPLLPVEERPVPQGAMPGDWTAPTQPFSPGVPSLGSIPGEEVEHLSEAHLWGTTPIDNLYCRIQFHRLRNEGMFTPPTDQGDGSIQHPGILGGVNWGSAAFDGELMIVNSNRMPSRVALYPREEAEDMENIAAIGEEGASYIDQTVQPMLGAPVAALRGPWLSPLDMPCTAPPWGFLSATNLRTGELVWSRLLGTARDQGPLGIPSHLKLTVGAPTNGGPVATTGGVVFIGASMDDYIRGFDTATGGLLWEKRLPAGGQATPMSYMHEGRQYVVIAAGGGVQAETTLGDSVIAYALPRDEEED